MEFRVLHLNSDSNNLLLEVVKEPEFHDAEEREKKLGIDKMALFLNGGKEKGKKVAEIFNAIASVEKPFFLAKPVVEASNWKDLILTSTRN